MQRGYLRLAAPLINYLVAEKGVKLWLAKHLAIRFACSFPTNAREILGEFERKGWEYYELFQLDNRCGTTWRLNPLHAIRLQEMFESNGCDANTARLLARVQKYHKTQVIQTIDANFKLFLSFGFSLDAISILAVKQPRAMLQTAEILNAWYTGNVELNRDPRVWTNTIPQLGKPLHLAKPKPLKPAKCVKPRREKVRVVTQVAMETAQSQPQPPPAPLPSRDNLPLKPLEFFNPATPKIVEPRPVAPPAETTEEDEEDETVNWYGTAKLIHTLATPDWSEEKWKAFLDCNSWLNNVTCNQVQNLQQLRSWFRISTNAKPQNSRVRFFACLLLNHDLCEDGRNRIRRIKIANLKRQTSHLAKLELQHMERLEQTRQARPPCDFHTFLMLAPEVVYFRMYTLMRILGRSPESYPELLLLPWENIQAKISASRHTFSVPPPAMSDERMWLAKREELMYRASEVVRLGKRAQPGKRPYLNILLEPDRERCLRRLVRYLENNDKLHAYMVDKETQRIKNAFLPAALLHDKSSKVD